LHKLSEALGQANGFEGINLEVTEKNLWNCGEPKGIGNRNAEIIAPNRAPLRNVAKLDNGIGRWSCRRLRREACRLAEGCQGRMSETQSRILASVEFAETDNYDWKYGKYGIMPDLEGYMRNLEFWMDSSSCRIQEECWELRIRQLSGIFWRTALVMLSPIMVILWNLLVCSLQYISPVCKQNLYALAS